MSHLTTRGRACKWLSSFLLEGSRVLCSLFLPVSVRAVLVGVLTMTSDVLFSLAVERLPKQLASAMAQKGLLSPAVLRYYPRKSAEELGLAPAQEVKMRKVPEGNITGIGFGTTIPIGHGGIVSIPKVDDGPMVCPGGFWSGAG